MNFSIIVPVYNRPDELYELLESLSQQTYTKFEIIVVEDGSTNKSDKVVQRFENQLDIKYFFKQNEGPALTRNMGMERAEYDYFVFFDSDCIIPENYFENVYNYLKTNQIDAYGGADKAHKNFSNIQKAISYSMTSFFTTGGIRGGTKSMEKFRARSFNMGFSRQVYERTKGFANMRFGEDVDLSLRIEEANFKTALIAPAFVYHKRRTNFRQFFKQVFNSGIARINLFYRHPKSLKLVHLLPAFFVLGIFIIVLLSILYIEFLVLPFAFILLIFFDSLRQEKSLEVAALSVVAAFVQLVAYGSGFLSAVWKRIILKKDEFKAFEKNFYK